MLCQAVPVSFIVPAYNEEQLLGRTLRALSAAGRGLDQPFEVIVADDASTDRTAAIARESGAVVGTVNHPQIAATRNAGARAASGDLLIFVDADTVVDEAVIRAAVEAIGRGAVGGGCSVAFDGRLPIYARVLLATALPVYRVAGVACGCFLFCTRDAFAAAGGFDEGLFGAEELVMSRALHRQGRFVILRERVTTSGRKLRAYSAREILGLLGRIVISGPQGVRRRSGLEIWYGERRNDPDMVAQTPAQIRTHD